MTSTKLSTVISTSNANSPRKPPTTNVWNRGSNSNSPAPRSPPPPPQGIGMPGMNFNTMNGVVVGGGSFPPLGQQAQPPPPKGGSSELLTTFSAMIDQQITIFTRTGARHQGTLLSVSPATASPSEEGVTLRDVRDLLNPSAPLRPTVVVRLMEIEGWNPAMMERSNGNAHSFMTDTEISGRPYPTHGPGPQHRQLESFFGDTSPPPLPLTSSDDITFGGGANAAKNWDQFAANSALFGVTTSFDESVYTTTLDRSKPGFREREREAERLASEIQGVVSSNPHLAEERGQAIVDDSGMNEEDKYGAVVRGAGAYVPPGARRPGAPAPPGSASATSNADSSTVPSPAPPSIPTTVVTPSAAVEPPSTPAKEGSSANKPAADGLVTDFRSFVTNEKVRLEKKRALIAKNEMDKRKAELLEFSRGFKLNKPIPDDLVTILAKDETKQRSIKEKSTLDAQSDSARAIGPSFSTTVASGANVGGKGIGSKGGMVPPVKKLSATTTGLTKGSTPPTATGAPSAQQQAVQSGAVSGGKAAVAPVATKEIVAAVSASASSTPVKKQPATSLKPRMVLQPIPAFNPAKARAQPPPVAATVVLPTSTSAPKLAKESAVEGLGLQTSSSAAAVGGVRLNINANSFTPNPAAPSFKPSAPASASSSSTSPPAKEKDGSGAPNPFFGSRVPKKTPVVHVKDEFNFFKHGSHQPAINVAATWPYTGKPYRTLFTTIVPTHQPNSTVAVAPSTPMHMPPPPLPLVVPLGVGGVAGGQPPPPPPQQQQQPTPVTGYEEDPNAAAQRGGYVYYAPYPYPQPHQQMMPGVPPPPPGGAYMHPQYIPHMGYPSMPPPNGPPMYAPQMAGMPPPHFMAPPPGAYPQPPNGNGPRPSIPPTPVPTHAHPYPYHQSPQLQHAVPYPMMMQHPGGPNGPQHVYDGGQPQQPPQVAMGNHS